MAQRLTNLRVDTRQFNPDTQRVRLQCHAAEDGFATLVVLNPRGGWILSLGEMALQAGANTITWHGHDKDGWPLADGLYYLEIFGFGTDHRPANGPALRVTVELVHRSLDLEYGAPLPFLEQPWFRGQEAGIRS